MIAYWSFEDSTSNDFSGNGYHGKIMNKPTPEIGVRGIGTSLHFKGFGVNSNLCDHIILPQITFEKLDEFTISMWVKEESVTNRGGEFYISFNNYINSVETAKYNEKNIELGTINANTVEIVVSDILGKVVLKSNYLNSDVLQIDISNL